MWEEGNGIGVGSNWEKVGGDGATAARAGGGGRIQEEGTKAHVATWEWLCQGDGSMDGGLSLIEFGVSSCLCLCDLLCVAYFTLKQHCVSIPNTVPPSTPILDWDQVDNKK